VPTVAKVRDLGHSPDGQAAQLQVLSTVSGGGSGSGLTTLVNDMRATISRDGPPPPSCATSAPRITAWAARPRP
jgi:hypothetical protein